jgi:hypothetical protein
VRAGDVLLLDDGKLVLDVKEVRGEAIHTDTRPRGDPSNNKGINRQGGGLTAPALTPKDIDDIRTAAKMEADYVAVSFPKSGADMYMARELLRAAGGHAMLIAKIERAEAIPALEDIMRACDGIMVARGDLAVEVGDATVPALQKRMIRQAREMNKLTITGDPDDGVDDLEPRADARRGLGRRQRRARRNRRRDALGRIGLRDVSGGNGGRHEPRLRRGGEVAERDARPRLPRPRLHARRPVDRHGRALHRLSPEREGDRLAHRNRARPRSGCRA